MKDLMVDIETLGVSPGAPILSMALVAFNNVGNGGFMSRRFRWEDQIRRGRKVDPGTLKFWFEQPREVADKWLKTDGNTPLRDEHLLSALWHYVERADRVWAYSPSFDLVFLTQYSQELSIAPPRNHYRKQRDVRTLCDYLTQEEMPPAREGQHDPLVDCLYQIDVVRSYWKKFGSPYGAVHAAAEHTTESVHPSGEEATAAAQEGTPG
jgi:hypothetical protein